MLKPFKVNAPCFLDIFNNSVSNGLYIKSTTKCLLPMLDVGIGGISFIAGNVPNGVVFTINGI